MNRGLKTTTALIASLSLIVPAPLAAQEEGLICPDGSELPCPEGVEPIPVTEAAPAEAEAPAEELPAVEEPASEPEVAEEPAAESVPAEEPVAEEAPAEAEQASGETAAEEIPADEPVAEQPAAEESAAEEALAEEPAPSEDDLSKALADEAEAEAAGAEEAAGETAAEEPAAEAPVVEEAVTEEPAAEDPEAEASDADAASSEDDLAKALAEEGGEAEAADEVPDLPVQPDAASGEAPVAAAAEIAEDVTEEVDEADVAVSEEVVTEESARSSSEDFANRVNEAATATTAKSASSDDDDGLSSGQKALLAGLGLLAVGAILSNNRKVELNSGDRVVVQRPDGSYQVIKDDEALMRQPGNKVRTETFADGSTRTTVTKPDGSRIVTIRDAEYRVLRRVHVSPEGYQTVLFDDTQTYDPVDVSGLPAPRPVYLSADQSDAELRAALRNEAGWGRSFSLAQIRDIRAVRELVPVIDLNSITFESGSAAIRPDQAKALSRLGRLIRSYVDENPAEVFLIEGHTDAVGSAAYNLALSDRRAESVALALTEYFDVPPENMVVQGYGEAYLKIQTDADERANRRAAVRRITELLSEG